MLLQYFIIHIILLSFLKCILSSETKLCINCKHFIKNSYNPKFSKCALFEKFELKLFEKIGEKINNLNYLVTGIKQENNNMKKYYHCSIARNCEVMCGVDGKKYESKDDEEYSDSTFSGPIKPIIPIIPISSDLDSPETKKFIREFELTLSQEMSTFY
jgi:hypothetical protein